MVMEFVWLKDDLPGKEASNKVRRRTARTLVNRIRDSSIGLIEITTPVNAVLIVSTPG